MRWEICFTAAFAGTMGAFGEATSPTKKPALPPAFCLVTSSRQNQCAASSAACSCRAIVPFTADCTFSKARTSICRTRSRDTPNSLREIFQRHRIFRQAPRLEDAAFASG